MAHTNPPIRYGLIAGALSLFALVYVAAAHPFSMSFKSSDSRWQVVVDGVMGGLSTGVIEDTSNGIMFSGDLSLENNGGFSQIRTPIRQGSLEGADGIEIEVRGDGRNYIFDARVANMRVMAGSFQHKFDTVGDEWTTIRLPFTDFKFHYFGRLMENVGSIEPHMINSLGVTLADYNPGDFGLEIRAIRGYVEGDVYDVRLAKLGEQLGLSVAVEEEAPAPDLSGLYAGRLDRLAAELSSREEERRPQRMMMSASDASRVMELCVLAIDRGAPLFNHGQHEACASIYEVTLASIYALGGENMDDHTRTMVYRSLRDGRRMHDAGDRAWHYRAALDALMRTFSGHV
jgi:NADH dehydrogenase [ubiquinone] 1 alpha subcomplex assembly factor 1